MRIAYFTNNYLPFVSGVVRSVSTFRKMLSELGHNVFVFTQEEEYQDEEPFIFRYPSIPLPIEGDISAVIPISSCMDRIIPSLKPEIIHSHHPVLLGQVAANKAQELQIPLVFTFHTQYREYTHYVPFTQEIVQDFLKSTIHNWLKDYMRKCQHIIVPSESMHKILVDEYGVRSNCTVLPTGIDLNPFQQAEGGFIREKHGWGEDQVMISVGRLAKEKNLKLLLEAVSMAIHQFPHLRVVLLGDGPELEDLRDFSVQIGIADRVEFLGEVSFDQVPAYLRAADFFGIASTTETQGLVTLEALAADLPVVAVDASGTRDVVQNGRQGILVNESPHALKDAICQLLSDSQRFAKFREEAHKRARQFDIKKVSEDLMDIYRLAIQGKKAGHYVEVQ